MEPDAVEIRVVGCLIEKQRTTPDVYPLTLNALRLACNQSTNRDPEISLLAVLMLRGAQTQGELKTRTERLHPFGDMGELTGTLDTLIERRLVTRLDRRPGQREERYEHLLGQGVDDEEEAAPLPSQPAPQPSLEEDGDRIARIERQLAELRAEIEALREELGA